LMHRFHHGGWPTSTTLQSLHTSNKGTTTTQLAIKADLPLTLSRGILLSRAMARTAGDVSTRSATSSFPMLPVVSGCRS
jgi:hypothetical protein